MWRGVGAHPTKSVEYFSIRCGCLLVDSRVNVLTERCFCHCVTRQSSIQPQAVQFCDICRHRRRRRSMPHYHRITVRAVNKCNLLVRFYNSAGSFRAIRSPSRSRSIRVRSFFPSDFYANRFRSPVARISTTARVALRKILHA